MIWAALLMTSLAAPSGTDLRLYDQRLSGGVAHLRYVAPAPLTYDAVADDFLWACEAMRDQMPGAREVVVVIGDREVEFGETNPEAVQFFELFDLTETGCIWRAF